MRAIPPATKKEIEDWITDYKATKVGTKTKSGKDWRYNRSLEQVKTAVQSAKKKSLQDRLKKLRKRMKDLKGRNQSKKFKGFVATGNNPFSVLKDGWDLFKKDLDHDHAEQSDSLLISRPEQEPSMLLYELASQLIKWDECNYFSIGKEHFT